MGLLHTISRLGSWLGNARFDEPHTKRRARRICRYEECESRSMMAADLIVGSVYYEQAAGDDLQPNIIEFTFQGGAPGTQLTRLVIDGDKNNDGISSGDVFFDTAPGGYGVFRSNPFKVVSSHGFTVTNFQVSDGGMKLIIDLDGFEAGETLVISIDVDEFQYVNGSTIDVNAVAEGGEFQRSHMYATFKAPHYYDVTSHVQYWDAYDKNFADAERKAGSKLSLPPDRYSTQIDLSDMTAGAIDVLQQPALPNSLSGVVYLDHNLNNRQDANDTGIAGVHLALLRLEGSSYVATGLMTVTDTLGRYKFDHLDIGTYRVVETQPAGYESVGATPGKVDGQTRGVVTTSDVLSQIRLQGGEDSVRNDFAEYLPVSIGGKVKVNITGDCENPQNPPLAGVTIYLLDASGNVVATAITDADGKYKFTNLRPGTYSVREEQPLGYFSGATFVGSAGGIKGDDIVSNIVLTSGTNAVNYDFCEIPPASISGFVYVDMNNNGIKDPGEAPIAGVILVLRDSNGQPTGTTATTNAQGYYEFTGLRPGTYGVSENQPAGYLDGLDTPGSAGGTAVNPGDLITGAVLIGGTVAVNYNFGELLPVSISGHVRANYSGDCGDPNNPPIAGVQVELLNSSGQVIATRTTNEQGYYEFDGLPPGTYSIREYTPGGYFDGGEKAGSAGGIVTDDLISNIVLTSGMEAVNYDFCEIPPAMLCGYVYVDWNNNGIKDVGEAGIAGVTVHLTDEHGNLLGVTVTTDANGKYCFVNLRPGTYGVRETQPDEYFDGLDTPGNKGGTAHNPGDYISGVVLPPGSHGEDYNFGELPPASIAGHVHLNTTGDCTDPDNPPLAGVTVELLDEYGNVIATRVTNADGSYLFDKLTPGKYSVREIQPVEYFNGGTFSGSAGGDVIANLISNIVLFAGLNAVEYNFCEIPPAKLSGHVFQDGPAIPVENAGDVPDVLAVRDGLLTPDDILLPGVVVSLRDGVTGLPIMGSVALGGHYAPDQPIWTVTNTGGYYEFVGLPPGVYAVYEVRPEGYFPGINTPGSTGGIVISPLVSTDPAILASLLDMPVDGLVHIPLLGGQHSTDNNFSVVITVVPQIILPPRPGAPDPFAAPGFLPLAPPQVPYLTPLNPFLNPPILTRTGGALYTWHLSVVDAGYPRGIVGDGGIQLTSMRPEDLINWSSEQMAEVEWTIMDPTDPQGSKRKIKFGMKNAQPISGDFNGDGKFEIGVFKDGFWFIDLNDNGVWDEGDLWAKLGHHGDRPVTGDWNGDGKTDIGIYGPAWSGDPRAIAHDPGMPDPHNPITDKHKNIPRDQHQTAIGKRTLKRTADGKPRSDLIDHVFLYGTPGDHPIVGDWNGDGIHTIAVFRDGMWRRDTNGDGRGGDNDAKHQFGQHGDIPVVGDFDGDGIDEVGVYRDGIWYLDTNHNGVIDDEDTVIQLGGPNDTPVVGDWNGDGRTEIGVFHQPPGHRMATGK